MVRSGYTSQASWLDAAVHALARRGLDSAPLAPMLCARGSGADRAAVEDIAEAWRIVAQRTGDPAIGARCGLLEFNPAQWQSLGLAAMCSTSRRDALQRIARYHRVVTDVATVSLRETATEVEFVVDGYRLDPHVFGHEGSEYGMGAVLFLLRAISPQPVRPLRVDLNRPEADGSPAFAELFGAPVRYGAAHLKLVFDVAGIDDALPIGNATLAAYQDRFSEEYLRRFERAGFTPRVKDAILRRLPGGEPTQAEIARELHVSLRNLQRKLQAEGTSFNVLLTELRVHLAKEYLAQRHRALCEVAYLLGFADQSNFARAVRRWYGVSPSALREQLSEP